MGMVSVDVSGMGLGRVRVCDVVRRKGTGFVLV